MLPRADIAAGDVLIGLPSSGVHSNGYSLVRRLVARGEARLGRAGAVRARTSARRGAAGADAHLREAGAGRRCATTGAIKALAHITGGGLSENLPRVLPDGLAAHVDLAAWRRRPCSAGCAAPAVSTTRRCCAPSTAASAWCVVGARPTPMRCCASLQAAGEAPDAHRRDRARPRREIAGQGQGRGGGRAILRQAGVRGMSAKKRVAILISGRGSNMMALVEAARAPDYPAEIAAVISSRPDAAGLAWAQAQGLPDAAPSTTRPMPSREAFDDAVHAALIDGARRPRRARRLHAHPVGWLRRSAGSGASSTSTPRCCPCSRACIPTSRRSTPA